MEVDKKILSIDSDDEGVDIKSFTIFMEDNTKRNKNKSANDFMEIGEDLLAEVEAKKTRKEKEKKKYIRYILRHSKIHIKSQLTSYSLEDVKDIYDEIRSKRPLRKAVHFIFNL
jgi:hypothetical protein